MAIGNAPLLPGLARLDGFDVVHIHYPFIFGSELTLLARLRKRRRRAALIVHYKNRLMGGGPRGALFEAYEHSVAPALIRAADRVLVLSPDHARSVSYLSKALDRTPERLIEMPNGVDTAAFSPGEDGSGLRERLGISPDAVVAAFVATLDRAHHFKRLDVAIEALARARSRELHLLVAGDGELLDGFRSTAREAGVGDRVHFLGRIPHAELPGRPARLRSLCADDRAAGVVRDRADRGARLRAARGRHRLPRGTGGDRRGRDRLPGRRRRLRRRRRGARPRRRRSVPTGASGWAPRVAPAASSAGPGLPCSTAWRRPMTRRCKHDATSSVTEMGATPGGRSILLVSYFYPPTRDTGARRPAALAKYLARLGNRVTVLTTTAFGERRRGDAGAEAEATGIEVLRAGDLQSVRARLAGPRPDRLAVRLRHLLGQAAPAELPDRARAAARRLGSVRPPRRAARPPAPAVRLP